MEASESLSENKIANETDDNVIIHAPKFESEAHRKKREFNEKLVTHKQMNENFIDNNEDLDDASNNDPEDDIYNGDNIKSPFLDDDDDEDDIFADKVKEDIYAPSPNDPQDKEGWEAVIRKGPNNGINWVKYCHFIQRTDGLQAARDQTERGLKVS